MKKLLFLIPAILVFIAAGFTKSQRKGHGAAKIQELGQAVFSGLQQNQFGSLNNYMPSETELRILKRRSSEDMRLLLEKTTPDTIKQNLQSEFNYIIEQTTGNTFNWAEWQLADTKATRRDKKNPLLYRVELTLANAAGEERYILLESLRIRGRYFLFKQMIFRSEK